MKGNSIDPTGQTNIGYGPGRPHQGGRWGALPLIMAVATMEDNFVINRTLSQYQNELRRREKRLVACLDDLNIRPEDRPRPNKQRPRSKSR